MKFYKRKIKNPRKSIRRLIPITMLATQARDKLVDIYSNFNFPGKMRRAAFYELNLMWWQGIPDDVIKKIDGYRLESSMAND